MIIQKSSRINLNRIRFHALIIIGAVILIIISRIFERANAGEPFEFTDILFFGSIASITLINAIFLQSLIKKMISQSDLFHGLFEFAPDAIISVDKNRKIDHLNAQTELLFGYKREELIGKEIEILIPERYRNRHIQHVSNYQKDPKVRPMGASGLSLVGRKSNGEEFPLSITLGPVQLAGSVITLAVVRDITVQKQAEKTIQNLNTELQNKIFELEFANRELNAFSYSVSHDLRAPLRSMNGFSKAVLDENNDTLNDEAKRKLNKVVAASEKMGSLVDALLNLAHLSRKEVKLEKVDLTALVKSILNELTTENPHLKIETIVSEGCLVEGDSNLLYVLLKNLLSNAVKFSSKKQIIKIEFGVMPAQGKQIYFVKDNGAGFDMKHANSLFKDFERLHHSSEFEGTGIGLSSTRRIVEKHGGKIWAESEPNAGSVFYFQI